MYVESYPGEAGTPKGTARTGFEELQHTQKGNNHQVYHPFPTLDEWKLAENLMRSGLSHAKIDRLLALPTMVTRANASFHNSRSLLQLIDAIPPVGPEFKCMNIKVCGNVIDADGEPIIEELELFHQDPVECVRELLGNTTFRDVMCYAPERTYVDEKHSERIYNDMWTADWWWNLQSKLPPGATIAPIILASDKTQLSQFSGDKSAWPVYLTIGNISKCTHRQIGKHAMILLGYIPVSKLRCFATADQHKMQAQRLFHYCLRTMLQPLFTAGAQGLDVTCADNALRQVFPILAAYIADFPEQALVACTLESWCPICSCFPEDRGDPLAVIFSNDAEPLFRDQCDHMADVCKYGADNAKALAKLGIRPVPQPFWHGLPHCDIFRSLTPDILHQLHKGVFKDHLSTWCTSLATNLEIDARFKALPIHPSVKSFKKGISTVSQWTGTEYKSMEKVFTALLPGDIPPPAVRAARALLDFIYLSQYPSHSTTTLQRLQDALERFHNDKQFFIDQQVCQHFHIPKFHMMEHYMANRASSRHDYTIQMTQWITRQEKVHALGAYVSWSCPDKGEEEEVQTDMEATGWSFHLAKDPGFPNTPVRKLIQEFHATHFLHALSKYMHRKLPGHMRRINEDTRLDVYKRVRFTLGSIQRIEDTTVNDVVHTIPFVPHHGRTPDTPAQFDTAIIHYGREAQETGTEGYRVGHVRAIFRLPADLEHPCPLAYVEWYSPFTQPVPGPEMYMVSAPSGKSSAAIVPVHSIRRSCHLIPHFGKTIDLSLRASNSLDHCWRFYVSDFLDLYTYQFFND
ncbi:hypothetical protein JB92DRAFT_3083509 [Gautieria morchelliformis]|nr:hypothetical protein JB92DRAFT_3083509 [Gautieria morchelliformis]